MYVYRINLYPSLKLVNKNVNATIEVDLISYNQNSQQQLKIKLNKNDINKLDLSRWWVFLIFISSTLGFLIITLIIFAKVLKGKKKEEKPQPLSKVGSQSSFSRTSQSKKTMRSSKVNRLSSHLESLAENVEEENKSDESDKVTLRHSMKYNIRFNGDDLLSEPSENLQEDSGVHTSIKMAYSRSSTHEFRETLQQKQIFGFKR